MKAIKSNNVCKQCNNYFYVNRPGKINNMFCSEKCRRTYIQEHPKVNKCIKCGKEYTKHYSNKKYCSEECYYSSRRKFERKLVSCLWCHKEFISKGKKFCDRDCYVRYDRLYPSKRKTGEYIECGVCKKLFYREKNQSDMKYCSKYCGDFSRRGKQNLKNSEKIAYLISIDKFPFHTKFKRGYYVSKITGEKSYYASSYELKRMEQLDKLGIIWTKCHKIKIPYIDRDGKHRYYVPDFLVDGKIIEEVKPYKLLNSEFFRVPLKTEAAEKFCKENGYEYKIITEKELEIKI